uniref:Uncharacterized protein n=1 Tax=uncultured organism MedDCM-OCT-S11-C346 TaxID=743660 RepID=D6PLE4_9ZZZZ|nr:hypothetical protein [uncultured organism MedDCM-OCT-S11-C346]
MTMPSKGLLTGFRAFVKRLGPLIDGLFGWFEMEHKCEQNLVESVACIIDLSGLIFAGIENKSVERRAHQSVVETHLEEGDHKIFKA